MASTGIHRLSARKVQTAADGDFADGGGLLLRIAGGNGAWVYRFTSPAGKRREMGLGRLVRNDLAAAGRSLTAARDQAEEARRLLREGVDPIDERDRKRAAAAAAEQAQKAQSSRDKLTVRRYVRQYHEKAVEPIRTPRHARAWISSIERNLSPALLDMPVADVLPLDLLDELVDVSRRIPETGSRIHNRLSAVFDAAVVERLRNDNPCRPIARELRRRVARPRSDGFAWMPWEQVPAFVKRLRAAPGTAPRSLELLILTAARTGEVLGMEWSEVDLGARLWTVPGSRMKMGREHVIYLSDRAVEILEAQRGQHERFVFPSVTGRDQPQSNMALLMALRRLNAGGVTAHGFRKSFSTWANEHGFRPDAIEAALAHADPNRVRGVYNKAQFQAERAALLQAWAAHCQGEAPAAASVVALPLRAA